MWKENKSLVIIGIVIFILSIGTVIFAALSESINERDVEITSEVKITSIETTIEETTIEETTTSEVTETTTGIEETVEPLPKVQVKVKGIYLSGPTTGNKNRLDHFIELANNTEINAFVIDVKESGKVNYKSNIQLIIDNKLYTDYFNPKEVIQKLHDNNIYVIARIVCFKDSGLAKIYPDRAIKKTDGTIWLEKGLTAWLNPYLEENWDYNIEIAREALELGFDEIQYDYIRFPTGNISSIKYQETELTKIEAINQFLKKSREQLNDAIISADVFGIICSSKGDQKYLGQELETVGLDIDYISPMIYASHYNREKQEINGIVIEKPDFYPYEVVYNALIAAKKRLELVENYRADIRPYIQDFTAKYLGAGYYQVYGEKQIREQIQAVYDAGYEEWIFWNGSNNYTEGAFLDQQNHD